MSLEPREIGALKIRARKFLLPRRVLLPAKEHLTVHETAGWPLMIAAAAALLWANSPWQASYFSIWQSVAAVEGSDWTVRQDLRQWINDLLLPLFFFSVGLDIKQQLVRGRLARWRRAAFPVATAVGGMIVPAILYLAIAMNTSYQRGWGIPVATDIAFALAMLALLGDRIPRELKVLTMAFAAVDDRGGVLIIAVFLWP